MNSMFQSLNVKIKHKFYQHCIFSIYIKILDLKHIPIMTRIVLLLSIEMMLSIFKISHESHFFLRLVGPSGNEHLLKRGEWILQR